MQYILYYVCSLTWVILSCIFTKLIMYFSIFIPPLATSCCINLIYTRILMCKCIFMYTSYYSRPLWVIKEQYIIAANLDCLKSSLIYLRTLMYCTIKLFMCMHYVYKSQLPCMIYRPPFEDYATEQGLLLIYTDCDDKHSHHHFCSVP